MLSDAETVFSAGPSRLSSSLGDQSLFLRPEDSAMRWFLLPSDHTQTTPPFQPRVYPPPPGMSPQEPSSVPEGEAVMGERTDLSRKSEGDMVATNSIVKGVCFSSPPKPIFKAMVEVSFFPSLCCLSVQYTNFVFVRLFVCPIMHLFVCSSIHLFMLRVSTPCQAIEEYSMIESRDKVLVCLSGGKDSLSLLHSLHQYQFMAKSKVHSFSACWSSANDSVYISGCGF